MNTQAIRVKRSRYGRFLCGGVAAALAVAGVALIGVLPASAAAATGITFSTITGPFTAGATIPSFTVGYSGGNGTTDNITISGCGVTGTLTATAAASSATFAAVVVNTAGSCTLTATDSSAGAGGTGTSNSFTVNAGSAYKYAFTTVPSSATAGSALGTVVLKLEDSSGNALTTGSNIADTVTITSACKLGGTVSAAAVAGVATFTGIVVDQSGSCQLTSTDALLTHGDLSTPISVNGGTPTKLVFTVAPPASVAATGTAVTSFAVSVEDVNGYVEATGTSVGNNDSISLSSPCLTAPVAITASSGVATFTTVEFSSTGSCVLTATDSTRSTTVTNATATVSVGQAQAAVTVTTKSGYLDAPLTLTATGGSGTGAVTFTVVNGTATGCAITSGTLKATKGGTCIVTATKAATSPYTVGVSAATTVTISSAPKAVRLVGTVKRAKTTTVTVTGYNFSGRPKVTSNVAGFTGLVTKDSGKTVTIRIIIKGTTAKPGVKTLSLAFANGAHASVKYSLH